MQIFKNYATASYNPFKGGVSINNGDKTEAAKRRSSEPAGVNDKLRIARAQLGTALHLFIHDKDPFSVQALACGGSELIEGLAETVNIPTLSTHILQTFPEFSVADIKRRRNEYWNAIKHFYTLGKKPLPRKDELLLAGFSDEANDAPLFMGWLDYLLLTNRLPVEAQVFQIWWYALNENALKPGTNNMPHRSAFPEIICADRLEQKRQLRCKIEEYRYNQVLLTHPKTENGPLMIEAFQRGRN